MRLPDQIWRGIEIVNAMLGGQTFLLFCIEEYTKSFPMSNKCDEKYFAFACTKWINNAKNEGFCFILKSPRTTFFVPVFLCLILTIYMHYLFTNLGECEYIQKYL